MPIRIESHTLTMRWSLVLAQLLALAALGFGLMFIVNTTGATLFLFSSIGPLLVVASSLIVLGVGIIRYRRSHSLFAIETLEAGQIVFRQGEAGDCAYFIQSGAVDVVRAEGGKEAVVARLGAGQYFGEMALLSNDPRNATIRAAVPTRLAVLGKENFLMLLNVLPSTREQVLKTIHDRSADH
jgi:hypothetical protein